MRRLIGVVVVPALMGAAVTPALAQQKMTLDKIGETGTLTIGTRTGSPPFAYVNARNEWVGFSDAALVVNNREIRPFPIDLFIAAVYWVCTYSMSRCARSLEKRIGPA